MSKVRLWKDGRFGYTPCLSCGNPLPKFSTNRPLKFCGNGKCQHDYMRRLAVESGKAGLRSTRRYLLDKVGRKCQICGISEWMGESLVLEIDHINGISNDHRLENLRILCPNCHSQTPTYKMKNLGVGGQKRHALPGTDFYYAYRNR